MTDAAHDTPQLSWPKLAEAGILLVCGFLFMSRIPDLTPILHHWTGFEGGQPNFAVRDPLYSLLRGGVAILMFSYLAVAVTQTGGRLARAFLSFCCWALIVVAVMTPAARDMFERAVVDQALGNDRPYRSATHDGGVLQVELAGQQLLEHGRNPYAVNYRYTEMARARDSDPQGWFYLGYPEGNPAFEHLPYLPVSFLAGLPLLVAEDSLMGWSDQRVFYILVALLMVWGLGRLVPAARPRRVVWILAGLSPLLLPFLRQGRNDVLLLLWFVVVAHGIRSKRALVLGVGLGLACATKQFAWPLLPVVMLYQLRASDWSFRASVRTWIAAAATIAAFCLPFFLWSPGDFLNDVLWFNLGLTDDSYPLRPDSLGLSSLVIGLGWATNLREGFPMWVFQVAITVPVTVVTLWRVMSRPTAVHVFAGTGLIIFSALFCSRFFAFNYMVVPAICFLLAGMAQYWPSDELSDV